MKMLFLNLLVFALQILECTAQSSFNVTVRIDVKNICAQVTCIDIAGPFNSWNGGDTLNYNSISGLHEITLNAQIPVLEYKVRYFTANSGPYWEGVANSIVVFNNDTVLPPRCFNAVSFGTCVPKPNPAEITFRVDFAKAGVTPAANIYLIADFTDWDNNPIQLLPSTGHPGVFETVVPKFCPDFISFRFSNGPPNTIYNLEGEGNSDLQNCGIPTGIGGWNRFYTRLDSLPHTLQFIWDSCQTINLGSDDMNFVESIKVYPNPANAILNIELPNSQFDKDTKIVVYNLIGNEILEEPTSDLGNTCTLNVEHLRSGLYILQVVKENEVLVSKRVIIND